MIHAVLRKRPPKPLGVVAERCDAGRIPVVRRRVSTLFFATSVLIWIAAIGLYIRSRFRADAITWVTPWHHCVLFEDDEGQLAIYEESNWPGKSEIQWTSGAAYLEPNSITSDTLLGPGILTDRGDPLWFWRGFGVLHGFALQHSCNIGSQLRGGWYWGGDPTRLRHVVVSGAWAPDWVLVVAPGIIPAPGLLTAGRRRYRAQSRRRRGLCVRCGYDLRRTPSRCPECGAQVGNERPSAVTPI